MGTYSNQLSGPLATLTDFLAAVLSVMPGMIAWASVGLYLRAVWSRDWLILYFAAVPILLVSVFLIMIRLLRAIVKRPKPGIYRAGLNRGFGSWLCTMYLAQAVRVAGLKPLIFTFYLTRFLYWRALGGNIAYGVNCSPFINISDLPLVTIREGVTIGAYTHIAAHVFRGEKVIVAPVTLGKGVQLGMNCVIGPGTRIGDQAAVGLNCTVGLHTDIGNGASIGAGNRIIGETIEEGATIGHFEWEYGDPSLPMKRDLM